MGMSAHLSLLQCATRWTSQVTYLPIIHAMSPIGLYSLGDHVTYGLLPSFPSLNHVSITIPIYIYIYTLTTTPYNP